MDAQRKYRTYVIFDKNETVPPLHVYVGQTVLSIEQRLHGHWRSVGYGSVYYLHNWMRSLTSTRDVRVVQTGEFSSRELALQSEREQVEFYVALGYHVTNMMNGGAWGRLMTEPTKGRIPRLPKKRRRGRPRKSGRKVGWRKDGNHTRVRTKLGHKRFRAKTAKVQAGE